MAQIFSNVAVSRTLLILILCAGVFFFIGFLVPVLAALIICFASWPLYNRLLASCNNRSALAASIASIDRDAAREELEQRLEPYLAEQNVASWADAQSALDDALCAAGYPAVRLAITEKAATKN